MKQIVCIGGGAASFFFAAHAAPLCPEAKFTILEQGPNLLGKVKISGGGRCNVTHDCPDADQLVAFYPRGSKELLGPFYTFGPSQTIAWFQSRGVRLKVEEDGRMFPVTDSSQTIIDCLLKECRQSGVAIRTRTKVRNIKPQPESGYLVELLDGQTVSADILFVAPGGSKQMWQVLGHLGHKVISPVPSLFTFQVEDHRLKGLSGLSVQNARVTFDNKVTTDGPLLITHRGLSGPAVLKMSAFAAREFASCDYEFNIEIDWIPHISAKEIRQWRDEHGKKLLGNPHMAGLPKRLYQRLIEHAHLDPQKKMASISNKEYEQLVLSLKHCSFYVKGQNRFKEEFVTAGGVDLAELDMRTFESKIFSGMFLAGEVLNIDAVTGGFNFQAAWTGAYIAAVEVARRCQ